MKSFITIIAGEPNSINSEIIAKAWRKKGKINSILIIGNYLLLKKQILKIGLKIPLVKINRFKEFKKEKKLYVLDVPLNFKSMFNVSSLETKTYIYKCFNIAHDLAIKNKIKGFINASIDKRIFNNQYPGVTEYISKKNKVKNKEVMMIYNKKLAVVPLTTHIELKKVTNKIDSNLISTKIKTLDKFYFRIFKKKPKIAVLGLNPHNSENNKNSIEYKIIKPTIVKLKKLKINIDGPYPADTAFNKKNLIHYDVLVGMYHDQVLAPFKALYGYDAINLTLGLKYLRLSPDHGTAQNIVAMNKANPQSLIQAIDFLNKIND